MTRLFTALSVAALFCLTSALPAQETFTDVAAFEAAICGTVLEDDLFFPEVIPLADDIPTPLTRPFGTIESDTGILFLGRNAIILNETNPTASFSLDPALGDVEGFCISYAGAGNITIFDGTTVVDTISVTEFLPPAPGDSVDICWLNSAQANVTSVEYDLVPGQIGGSGIFGVDFSFKDFSDTVASCRSLVQDLIADVAMIAPVEGSYDQQFLDCAIAFLGCADHDSLWVDDDRVTNCDVFFFLFKATKCLDGVTDSPEVVQALDDIQAVLSCLVENELAAAEAAGGDAGLIECAQYYQSCADAQQAAGNFRKATVLRKIGWLKAVFSF